VGWAYAPAAVADAVDRIRLPFNTSIAGQAAAIAALADDEFQARSLAHVEQWRPWLTQQLGGLGLEVVPSAANFLLIGFPRSGGRVAAEAEAFLARRGLIVRGVAGYGLPDHLRLTIGLETHNRAVIEALADFMARAPASAEA
jgi:histidinol-phosphate aminotransferase